MELSFTERPRQDRPLSLTAAWLGFGQLPRQAHRLTWKQLGWGTWLQLWQLSQGSWLQLSCQLLARKGWSIGIDFQFKLIDLVLMWFWHLTGRKDCFNLCVCAKTSCFSGKLWALSMSSYKIWQKFVLKFCCIWHWWHVGGCTWAEVQKPMR